MLSHAQPIDKIWAISPKVTSFATPTPADRLNVDDAELVEILLTHNTWLNHMGDKPLGHVAHLMRSLIDQLDYPYSKFSYSTANRRGRGSEQ